VRPKKCEESFITSIKLACKRLKGFAKHQYIAQMAINYFDSSPRKIETHVGFKRKMVDLAIKEFKIGLPKRWDSLFKNFPYEEEKEEKTNPCLITDISGIVEEHIQIDSSNGRRLSKL
jgi:hypothetical protein